MHPGLGRTLAPLGGGALALLAAGALGLLAPPASGASPRTVRCDYSTADYRIRELPFRGGFFSPDSRRMAYPEQGEVRIWSIAKRKAVGSFTPEDEGPPVTQILQWAGPRPGAPGRIFFTRGAATGGRPTPDPEDPNRTVYGQVWVVDPDGGRARQVEIEPPAGTEVIEYGVPRVSPDGRRVGYTFLADLGNQIRGKPTNGWRLAVARISYGRGGRVSFERPEFLTNDSHYNEAKDWSGDSTKFVFASTRGQGDDRRALNSDAFVIDVRSGEITRLTHPPSWEEAHDLLRGDLGRRDADVFISDRATPNPMTSPYYGTPSLVPNDADSVLVATSVPSLAAWTSHQLFVAGPRGDRGWVRRLTFDYDAVDGWVARVPIWSPDGRHIRFDEWRAHGATALGQRERLLTFRCRGATG